MPIFPRNEVHHKRDTSIYRGVFCVSPFFPGRIGRLYPQYILYRYFMTHELYNTAAMEIHAMVKLTVTTIFKGDLRLQLVYNNIMDLQKKYIIQ